MEGEAIRGRGAAENPTGRFERLSHEPDAEAELWPEEDGEPRPRTEYYRDHSKSVLTHNDSPDVGFAHSVNPYRGCEHGCAYCVSGDTLVLTGDGRARPISDLSVGDEIYGTVREGGYRRYTRTTVLAHWSTTKPAYRVVLADGTELIASGDHRFLTERGWKHVARADGSVRAYLTRNSKLMGTGRFWSAPCAGPDYRQGYLCGMVRGDGLLASYPYERVGRRHGDQHQFRLALVDLEALARTAEFLAAFGIPVHWSAFSGDTPDRAPMRAIRNHARADVDRIRDLAAWPSVPSGEWHRGFLAGIFDAEGSCSGGILRITNTDRGLVQRTIDSAERLGFRYSLERRDAERSRTLYSVRLLGGLHDALRLFQTIDPAIRRKCDIEGSSLKSGAELRVLSVEPLGHEIEMYDITTGTGDFIANGVVSHNCYARPTHEWLGLSAGLDFETKIFVKERAPELLRKALSSPKWQGEPVAMSGVTDPYQPVERRLRLTRRCLEVLAECGNPVGIVTKNHLVTRDADLLGRLASHDAAVVHLSVTTLDPELQRVMEPRASTPARRLEAISELAAAGVPVGVLVAPVIPGLTDHELPAILKAAAEAGARTAGFIPLRLPFGLPELFEAWLERHFPERKEKVLHRIREIRGGALNDPRFGTRMRGEGEYAEQLRALFHVTRRRLGLDRERLRLSSARFVRPAPPARPRPGSGQLDIFD